MNPLYLDTNIFLYATDPKSVFYDQAITLLHSAKLQHLPLITSTETLQEIIHTSKKAHKLKLGLKICQSVLKLATHLLPIDKSTITQYLKNVSKYPQLESRDCLHLAVCIVNQLPLMVSQDKHFQKIVTKSPRIKSLDQTLSILSPTN